MQKCHELSQNLQIRHDRPAGRERTAHFISTGKIRNFAAWNSPKYWRGRYGLSERAAGVLMRHASQSVHARKEIIVEEGQRDQEIRFVTEGSARSYVMREDKLRDPLLRVRGRSDLIDARSMARRHFGPHDRDHGADDARAPAARGDRPALRGGRRTGRLGPPHGRRAAAPARGVISPTSHGATRASSTSAYCANIPNYCSASR